MSEDKAFVRQITELLGFIPVNVSIFKLAFAHKSAILHKELYAIQNNERLEYLGDAVLGTIVAEYLFRKYPNKDEGFLTKMRSKIVNRKSLNEIGEYMGLDSFIAKNGNKMSRAMLGNALEAFIGAVYLDVGYYETRKYVINKLVRGYLNVQYLETFDDNYKSQLLEWSQKNSRVVNYVIVEKTKLDNRDYFKVSVTIDDKSVSLAEDFSKKSAEQKASKIALEKIGVLK